MASLPTATGIATPQASMTIAHIPPPSWGAESTRSSGSNSEGLQAWQQQQRSSQSDVDRMAAAAVAMGRLFRCPLSPPHCQPRLACQTSFPTATASTSPTTSSSKFLWSMSSSPSAVSAVRHSAAGRRTTGQQQQQRGPSVDQNVMPPIMNYSPLASSPSSLSSLSNVGKEFDRQVRPMIDSNFRLIDPNFTNVNLQNFDSNKVQSLTTAACGDRQPQLTTPREAAPTTAHQVGGLETHNINNNNNNVCNAVPSAIYRSSAGEHLSAAAELITSTILSSEECSAASRVCVLPTAPTPRETPPPTSTAPPPCETPPPTSTAPPPCETPPPTSTAPPPCETPPPTSTAPPPCETPPPTSTAPPPCETTSAVVISPQSPSPSAGGWSSVQSSPASPVSITRSRPFNVERLSDESCQDLWNFTVRESLLGSDVRWPDGSLLSTLPSTASTELSTSTTAPSFLGGRRIENCTTGPAVLSAAAAAFDRSRLPANDDADCFARRVWSAADVETAAQRLLVSPAALRPIVDALQNIRMTNGDVLTIGHVSPCTPQQYSAAGELRTPIASAILSQFDIQLGYEGRAKLKTEISRRLSGRASLKAKCFKEISAIKHASVRQLFQISEVAGCLNVATEYFIAHASESNCRRFGISSCGASRRTARKSQQQKTTTEADCGSQHSCNDEFVSCCHDAGGRAAARTASPKLIESYSVAIRATIGEAADAYENAAAEDQSELPMRKKRKQNKGKKIIPQSRTRPTRRASWITVEPPPEHTQRPQTEDRTVTTAASVEFDLQSDSDCQGAGSRGFDAEARCSDMKIAGSDHHVERSSLSVTCGTTSQFLPRNCSSKLEVLLQSEGYESKGTAVCGDSTEKNVKRVPVRGEAEGQASRQEIRVELLSSEKENSVAGAAAAEIVVERAQLSSGGLAPNSQAPTNAPKSQAESYCLTRSVREAENHKQLILRGARTHTRSWSATQLKERMRLANLNRKRKKCDVTLVSPKDLSHVPNYRDTSWCGNGQWYGTRPVSCHPDRDFVGFSPSCRVYFDDYNDALSSRNVSVGGPSTDSGQHIPAASSRGCCFTTELRAGCDTRLPTCEQNIRNSILSKKVSDCRGVKRKGSGRHGAARAAAKRRDLRLRKRRKRPPFTGVAGGVNGQESQVTDTVQSKKSLKAAATNDDQIGPYLL